MNSFRRWLYKPKKTDSSLLAQFFFADEELNTVASELDSFDGRKDPERCTALVNQLRACQDKVLGIVQQMMEEAIPVQRASRDFRVKFPDDVVQENLAGQLWFGAECLAAGSSIMNREVESTSMRPLARALTKNLESLRSILREQCLKNINEYTERIKEALVIFDKLFAEFELSYVSAMVPVKTMKEYDMIQEITVLFSETVQRAMSQDYLSQEIIDEYDPALMFTIPRLAIVCGLLIYPEGPLNPDNDPWNMSDMFRPFQALLFKIRELLTTLSRDELHTLERSLCTAEGPPLLSVLEPPVDSADGSCQTDFEHNLSGSTLHADMLGGPIFVHSPGSGSPVTPVANPDFSVGAMPSSASCMTVVAAAEDEEERASSQDLSACMLNKCDSNDSGLHSENVSNSDSMFTVSSSESQQTLNLPECAMSVAGGEVTLQEVKETTLKAGDEASDFHSGEEVREVTLTADKEACVVQNSEDSSPLTCEAGQNSNEGVSLADLSSNNTDSFSLTPKCHCDKDDSNEQCVWDMCHSIVRSVIDNVAQSNSKTENKDKVFDGDIDNHIEGAENNLDEAVQSDISDLVNSIINSVVTRGVNHIVHSVVKQSTVGKKPAGGHSNDTHLSSIENCDSEGGGAVSKINREKLTLAVNPNQSSLCDSNSDTVDKAVTRENHLEIFEDTAVTEVSLEGTLEGTSVMDRDASTVLEGAVASPDSSPRLVNKDEPEGQKGKNPALTGETEEGSSGGECLTVPRIQRMRYAESWSSSCSSCRSGGSSIASECEWDKESCASSETSSYNSECHDDEEIALAIQAAELASRNDARMRFRSSSDMIHRLFVCISGVADQLQTNFASDLRNILRAVFDMNCSEPLVMADNKREMSAAGPASPTGTRGNRRMTNNSESRSRRSEPPQWVPDEQSPHCMACKTPFTFVRRRHHCRNCGKIYCGRCSANSVPLPQYGHTKPVRVCNRCFMFQVTAFTMSQSS